MSSPSVPVFERVRAHDVAALIPSGVHGVFARHVAATEPSSLAFHCRETSEWALGGPLCGRLEVPEIWALLKSARGLEALEAAVRQLPLTGRIATVVPMSPLPDLTDSSDMHFDLHFVGDAARRPSSASHALGMLSMEDFGPGRMHDEIRSLLGHPQSLIQDFGDLS